MIRPAQNFGRWQVVCYLGLLGILVATAAYFTMLTGFAFYDDEGTFMLTVKQYLGGMRLYEDVLSFYGPIYYFYNALLRTVTGTPVGHDVTRISSVLPWTVVSLLCSSIALRLTKSLVVAAISLTAVSLTTGFFSAEPGHPQELTLLFMVALVACPLYKNLCNPGTTLMFTLGALAAGLLLIKVNIGIFVLAALALALLSQGPAGRIGRALGVAIGGGCILLPAALMRSHLDASWALDYCVLMTASILALVLCLFGMRGHRTVTWQALLWAAVGCASTVAVVVAVMAAQGVSMKALLDAVVFLPARIFTRNRSWYVAPLTSVVWEIWAVVGAGFALHTVWKQPAPGSRDLQLLLRVKTAIVAIAAVAIILGRMRGLYVFNMSILPLVTPFAWLVLFHLDEIEQEAQAFPRALLCAVATVQTLYGYPVMGSQREFSECLLLVLLLVCLHDSFNWLTAFGARPVWFARWSRGLAASGLAAILLLNIEVVWARHRIYSWLPALDLHGARLLHIQPELKEEFVPLVNAIRLSCDAFESLPGFPSLNFWTEVSPLTGLNFDAWTLVFSREQQEQLIAALSRHDRACIVYNPVNAAFWNPGYDDLEELPLVQYVRKSFKPVAAFGEYQLMIRKERSWDIADRSLGAGLPLR